MIKLAFMMDEDCVIGASTPEGNKKRSELLPKELESVLAKITHGNHMAAGTKSLEFYTTEDYSESNLYVITHMKDLQVPEAVTVVNDYMTLVKKFEESEDELIVIGGLEIFKLFLPHTHEMVIAVTNEKVPGDLVFNDWKDGSFDLVETDDWGAGKTYHYVRTERTVQRFDY